MRGTEILEWASAREESAVRKNADPSTCAHRTDAARAALGMTIQIGEWK